MSTEVFIEQFKKNNIAQQALALLEKFAHDNKLNVLPKSLEKMVGVNSECKLHEHQKKSAAVLLAELQKLPEYHSDFELLNKHHNRRIDNLYNPDNKKPEGSPYEQLIRAAASAAIASIKDCFKEIKPIKPEINYFYILYNLNDLLLNYWDTKNRLLLDKNNFKDNLISLYSLNLQIQMCLEGFKKVLAKKDPLKKILETIGLIFFAEEVNQLKIQIKSFNSDLIIIEKQAENLKPQQTKAYPTLNITAQEFEDYQQKIAYREKVTSFRHKYHASLGFRTPPPSPAAKPATAPDTVGDPVPPLKRHHNTM